MFSYLLSTLLTVNPIFMPYLPFVNVTRGDGYCPDVTRTSDPDCAAESEQQLFFIPQKKTVIYLASSRNCYPRCRNGVCTKTPYCPSLLATSEEEKRDQFPGNRRGVGV